LTFGQRNHFKFSRPVGGIDDQSLRPSDTRLSGVRCWKFVGQLTEDRLPYSRLQCLRIFVSFLHRMYCKVPLPLHQSLTRSILNYGTPIYGLAPPSRLVLLDSIQDAAVRMCPGAFRMSPSLNLYADAGLPPLHSLPASYHLRSLHFTTTYSIQFPVSPCHIDPTHTCGPS